MYNYDFRNLLSPDEFELFSRDILSKKLKLDLKTFADGADGGVDIKYSFNHNN